MMNMVATADDKAELGGLRAGEGDCGLWPGVVYVYYEQYKAGWG
jgi:hypothetical protein